MVRGDQESGRRSNDSLPALLRTKIGKAVFRIEPPLSANAAAAMHCRSLLYFSGPFPSIPGSLKEPLKEPLLAL